MRKNWEPVGSQKERAVVVRGLVPLLLGPELAIAKIPAPVNRSSEWSSSSLKRSLSLWEHNGDPHSSQSIPVNAGSAPSGASWVA